MQWQADTNTFNAIDDDGDEDDVGKKTESTKCEMDHLIVLFTENQQKCTETDRQEVRSTKRAQFNI